MLKKKRKKSDLKKLKNQTKTKEDKAKQQQKEVSELPATGINSTSIHTEMELSLATC